MQLNHQRCAALGAVLPRTQNSLRYVYKFLITRQLKSLSFLVPQWILVATLFGLTFTWVLLLFAPVCRHFDPSLSKAQDFE